MPDFHIFIIYTSPCMPKKSVGINNSSPKVALDVCYDFATTTFENQLSLDEGGGKAIKYGSGTLTAGKLYYLNTSAAWTLTNATAAGAGDVTLLGVALGSSPTSSGVLLEGYIRLRTDYVGGTPGIGKKVYMSTSAGLFHFTQPSAVNSVSRSVGYCVDTHDDGSILLYFKPCCDHEIKSGG